MGKVARRGKAAMLAVGAALAVVLLAGCPREADDGRAVSFSIVVTYDGTFPREPDPQRLTVGAADVEALGVTNPVVVDDFGSFTIRTSTVAEGDARFSHCLEDPIVITDGDTGEVVHTVPAGTCLTEGKPLRSG